MENNPSSSKITHISWGRIKVADSGSFRDVKIYPGGVREWNWKETGTDHAPGIRPADVQELLEHGAEVVVLSKGMQGRLQVAPETLEMLKERGVEYHHLQTERAVELYNKLRKQRKTGGLFHSTC
jgi:hypothetical protein